MVKKVKAIVFDLFCVAEDRMHFRDIGTVTLVMDEYRKRCNEIRERSGRVASTRYKLRDFVRELARERYPEEITVYSQAVKYIFEEE